MDFQQEALHDKREAEKPFVAPDHGMMAISSLRHTRKLDRIGDDNKDHKKHENNRNDARLDILNGIESPPTFIVRLVFATRNFQFRNGLGSCPPYPPS